VPGDVLSRRREGHVPGILRDRGCRRSHERHRGGVDILLALARALRSRSITSAGIDDESTLPDPITALATTRSAMGAQAVLCVAVSQQHLTGPLVDLLMKKIRRAAV